MPYANLWDETSPAGSSAANALDTDITDDKKATRERLNSLIGVATTTPLADPVIPSSNSLATLRSELTAAQAAITTLNTLQTYVKTIHAFAYATIQNTTGAHSPQLWPPGSGGHGGYIRNFFLGADAGSIAFWAPLDIPIGAIITEVRSYWYSSGTETPDMDGILWENLVGGGGSIYNNQALTNAGYQNRVPNVSASMALPYTVPTGIALVCWVVIGAANTTSEFMGQKITYTSANPNIRI